jgi:class 3 adenylate cyclase
MAEDIAQLLDELGLDQYVQAFAENGIDLDILPSLSDDDLNELGLNLGDRRRLQRALQSPSSDEKELAASALTKEQTAATTEAERRQLTVMFCDLVGSTELSARLDPEDLREVMRRYQDAVAGAITRYNGHIAKYLGDGILAYFGWPQAYEDQAERAIRAGLDAMDAVESARPGGGLQLNARVGIATGQVVIGDLIGDAGRDVDAVTGETPNLAARLQGLAEPGHVVIDAGTYRLIGIVFELEELGVRDLKGFAEPVPAWRVVGAGRAESRFEAAHAGHLTALVGRENEVDLLFDRWEQSRGGDGQAVLLAGEAGIGKSRITQVLRERISEECHTDLRYQCSPHYQSTALHPFIAQLKRAAGLAESDTEEARLDKLEAHLHTAANDITEAVPLFAALLSIATGSRYPKLELSPQQQMQRTQEALLDHLTGLAARQPVFVLFEDIHWADPTTLVALEQMVDRLQQLSALAVITFRAEFQPPWAGRTYTTTLTLNRLNRRQAAAMVENLAGGKPFPEEVLDQIVDKTDGVPLFVEELTKTILELGQLEERADRYLLSGSLPSLAIPNTLRDSLIVRLDHLASIKEVAQTAAVIGREFSHKLLAALSPLSDDGLVDALDRLIDAELVFRRGSPPNAEYVFKHALVCDAAYETLLKRNRRALHTRICTVLEERFPYIVESEPELIAYHATRAKNHALAIDYWLRAGERAASQSANIEAVSHLRNGLELLPKLPQGGERDRIELSHLISLGPALMATVGWDAGEVDETYSRARKLATTTNQPGVLFP